MNNDTINFNDFNREAKRRERKEAFRSKLMDVKAWVINNKEEIVILTPLVVAGTSLVGKSIKSIGRNAALRKEANLRDFQCYDPSQGHYWKLKRKLSNDEWLAINRRKQSGESMGDILSDMKVLK